MQRGEACFTSLAIGREVRMGMVLDAATLKRLVISLPIAVVILFGISWLRQARLTNDAPSAQATFEPRFVAPTPATGMTFVAPTFAPTSAAVENPAPYPIYGPAAELHDDVWLNTDVPMSLANLRGRVVLLEFWAFDCLPCVPVLSNVRAWYETYGGQGLTVIGVHYPKIPAERSYDALVAALTRFNIAYPVAQDNDGSIWQSYGQLVWPTLSLIDKRGFLRYRQVGAGGSDATEAAIRALLAES